MRRMTHALELSAHRGRLAGTGGVLAQFRPLDAIVCKRQIPEIPEVPLFWIARTVTNHQMTSVILHSLASFSCWSKKGIYPCVMVRVWLRSSYATIAHPATVFLLSCSASGLSTHPISCTFSIYLPGLLSAPSAWPSDHGNSSLGSHHSPHPGWSLNEQYLIPQLP